jgi:hypothetical protein
MDAKRLVFLSFFFVLIANSSFGQVPIPRNASPVDNDTTVTTTNPVPTTTAPTPTAPTTTVYQAFIIN